jgi:hypothetical protein
VTDDFERRRRLLEAQVEHWIADAKKLLESGKETAALELYRRAADELPGAPWLQHRTAELSRKLKQDEVSIAYYRRAATAFQLAGFTKRAVAPLRSGWTLAIDRLPATARALVDIAPELMQLYRHLGFVADATLVLERTDEVLRAQGFSELPPDSMPPRSAAHSVTPGGSSAPSGSSAPASSGPPTSSSLPASSKPPLSSKPPMTSDPAPSSRRQALARLLTRR